MHWEGRYPLLATLLVTLLLLRLLLGQAHAFIPPGAVALWVVISVAILVWQVVGSWRAADRYLQSHGGFVFYWCILAVLLVTIVLTVLQVTDALTGRRTVTEQSTVAVVVEKPRLPVSDGATTVVFDGDFSWEMRRAFLNTIEAYPTINTVSLNSNGGLVFVGRALALTIAEHRLDTHVEDHCYSACTIAFIAGDTRSLGVNASLGFHQYLLENANQTHGISVQEELEVDRAHFASNGVSEEFINRLYHADHTGLWMPDHQLLREAGVLTK